MLGPRSTARRPHLDLHVPGGVRLIDKLQLTGEFYELYLQLRTRLIEDCNSELVLEIGGLPRLSESSDRGSPFSVLTPSPAR